VALATAKEASIATFRAASGRKKFEIAVEKLAVETQAKRHGSAVKSCRSGGAIQQKPRQESEQETDAPESAEKHVEIDEIAQGDANAREEFDPTLLEDFSDEIFDEDLNNDGSGDGDDNPNEEFPSSVMACRNKRSTPSRTLQEIQNSRVVDANAAAQQFLDTCRLSRFEKDMQEFEDKAGL
jgi:hypothetical protein